MIVNFLALSVIGLLGTTQPHGDLKLGDQAITCSATPATGKWAAEHPFDARTYGLNRGVSPATSHDSKIVLYTRILDKGFFRLARRLDKFLAKHPELEWSFVQVLDEKGAQRGGYTANELQTRLSEVRELVAQAKIKHLSFTISAPNAASFGPQLGMAGPQSLVLAVLVAGKTTNEHPQVGYVRHLESSDITDKVAADAIVEIGNQIP